MTGPMQGADASGLRELARTMQSASTQLDAIRTRTRGRLYAANWQGRDAVDFARLWEGQLQNLLLRNAQGLSAAAGRLVQEADQQTAASSSGGPVSAGAGGTVPRVFGRGLSSGGFGDARGGQDWLGRVLGVSDSNAFSTGMAIAGFGAGLVEAMSNRVRSYTRASGKVVDSYVRWNRGVADSMRALPSANELSRWTRYGKVLPVLGPVLVGAGQFQKDGGQYTDSERWGRTASAVLGAAAVEVGQDLILAAGVAALVAGGPAGLVVAGTMLAGYVLIETYNLDEIIGSAAADGFSAVSKGAVEAVELGQAALEGAGELTQSVGEAASRAWDKITPW